MKKIALASAIFLSFLAATGAAQTNLGWPEVVNRLTQEKQQAITCVGLLKSSGGADSVKASYELARGDVEGVIAGLSIVLVEGGKPDMLPTVRESLEKSGKRLKDICDAAVNTLPANSKGVWDEVAKATVEPAIKAISDGIAGLWTWKVDNDKLALETRKTKLEAAKWPEFGGIPAL